MNNLELQVEQLVEKCLEKRNNNLILVDQQIEKQQYITQIINDLTTLILQQTMNLMIPIQNKILDMESQMYNLKFQIQSNNKTIYLKNNNSDSNENNEKIIVHDKMLNVLMDYQIFSTQKYKDIDQTLIKLTQQVDNAIDKFNEFKSENSSKFYTYWVMLNDFNEQIQSLTSSEELQQEEYIEKRNFFKRIFNQK